MKLIDLTLETVAANVALDEALLDAAESQADAGRDSDVDITLRLWMSDSHSVVLGRSCRAADEVHLDICKRQSIPVIRRSSGGGTIITGPGCLMYAVVITYDQRSDLRMIDRAHQYVLQRMQSAFKSIDIPIESKGQSDLVITTKAGDFKFSGNAMRCKRNHFLYHGTLLCDFDLDLIPRLLKPPPREPDYREGRSHQQFVTNLDASETEIREALIAEWNAIPVAGWPESETTKLVVEEYSQDEWNFRM